MAEAEAMADPAIAPISMAAMMLINANPPGNAPTMVLAKLISRSAIPPCVINCPESTKKGMASSAKLSKPVAMRWAMVVTAGSMGMDTTIVSKAEMAILQATGVPMAIKKIKLKTRMKTGSNSMIMLNVA